MDQTGKVVNPARGQLNRENEHREFGLARRVRPSRPASACLLSILRLNLVLFVAASIYLIQPPYAIGSNLNASKPSEHPPSGEKMSKGLGGNIGCRDKTSSWYQTGSPM